MKVENEGYNYISVAILNLMPLRRDQQQRLTAFGWLLRLSRSLSQFETQDIKTQPQFNHYIQRKEGAEAR